jgi:hypothetical protein
MFALQPMAKQQIVKTDIAAPDAMARVKGKKKSLVFKAYILISKSN